MLCSRCSETVRPVVAIDIDGTLGDYHTHFIEFAEEYVGRPLMLARNYRGACKDGPFRRWFAESSNIGTEEYRAIKLAYRQGGMKRSMPIIPGATALCGLVHDMGAELWMTTTRPYLSLDNIVPDTVEWLSRHEIEYDGMLFDEDKYRQLTERIDPERVVAIFDDLTEMCIAAQKVMPDRAILVSGRYNRGCRFPVMCDLDSALDIVAARIGLWKDRHAS